MAVCYFWPRALLEASAALENLQTFAFRFICSAPPPSGTSWQLFFWIADLSNEHYWDVQIITLGFYLRHLEGHLLAIFLQDVCQQTQGPLPGNDVLLLHLRPHSFCLLPAVCLVWKQQDTKRRGWGAFLCNFVMKAVTHTVISDKARHAERGQSKH